MFRLNLELNNDVAYAVSAKVTKILMAIHVGVSVLENNLNQTLELYLTFEFSIQFHEIFKIQIIVNFSILFLAIGCLWLI